VIGEYVGRTFLSANGKPQSALRTVTASAPVRGREDSARTRGVVSL